MNLPRLLRRLAAVSLLVCTVSAAAPATPAGGVYELRTYTATPGNAAKLLARFRDHTLKLFERHGMVNVGYWLAADDKDGGDGKLVYLLRHRSREAAKVSWQGFAADPDWKAVARASEAGGKLVAKLESVFLAETDFSAPMDAGGGARERVFELRTYVAAPGKLPGLDARFRDHTRAIFARHGMTNLGYFHPSDGAQGAGTTLIYFLAHASREAAAASWKAFREDPAWAQVRTASERDGKLTASVTALYLRPTDFSRIR